MRTDRSIEAFVVLTTPDAIGRPRERSIPHRTCQEITIGIGLRPTDFAIKIAIKHVI